MSDPNIFCMNPNKQSLGDQVEIGYTKTDNPAREPPAIDANDEHCYAKTIRTEREHGIHYRYYVRGKTTDGFLLDPWDSGDIERNARLASALNRDPYKFVEVSKAGFDLYMLFLRGRSVAYLQKASREIKHI
jgi:hypothetical protein